MRRRLHENIELDVSLRQSRSIWLGLAIVLFPFAAAGVTYVLGSVIAIVVDWDGGIVGLAIPLVISIVGMILLLADVIAFGQFREAGRRLRQLQEDPNARIRPLPAPFQSALFGPYH